jgi:hypothetical protein
MYVKQTPDEGILKWDVKTLLVCWSLPPPHEVNDHPYLRCIRIKYVDGYKKFPSEQFTSTDKLLSAFPTGQTYQISARSTTIFMIN